MVLPVRRCLEILIRSDGLHPAKVIQHPHLCDVELGEEPVVVARPLDHLGVTSEQRFLCKLRLCPVHLLYRSRQDDVSTERTLRVKALLPAVISLSQRHGQRRHRAHLQVLHGDLHAGQVHVRHPGTRAPWPVAHREDIRERLAHHRFVGGDGGHGGPVHLVRNEARDPSHLVMRRDVEPGRTGQGKGGQGEAEEEDTHSPPQRSHLWLDCMVASR